MSEALPTNVTLECYDDGFIVYFPPQKIGDMKAFLNEMGADEYVIFPTKIYCYDIYYRDEVENLLGEAIGEFNTKNMTRNDDLSNMMPGLPTPQEDVEISKSAQYRVPQEGDQKILLSTMELVEIASHERDMERLQQILSRAENHKAPEEPEREIPLFVPPPYTPKTVPAQQMKPEPEMWTPIKAPDFDKDSSLGARYVHELKVLQSESYNGFSEFGMRIKALKLASKIKQGTLLEILSGKINVPIGKLTNAQYTSGSHNKKNTQALIAAADALVAEIIEIDKKEGLGDLAAKQRKREQSSPDQGV